MKIVILGAGGRLGAALARTWSATDEVAGLARADINLGKPGDIDRVLDPLGFDVLVNCAALTNVDYCETHEEEAMRINAAAVREIGALCARKHARCLHISTEYVFDGETDQPYTETDAAHPLSIYGESKLRGEQALFETSPEHLAVRVSWVFGPDRPSFIDLILKRALEFDAAEAVGDKWSAPSFTLDLAGMLRPFLRDIAVGGLLHTSNSGVCTWREYGEYALQCAARAGIPVKTTQVNSIPLAGMKSFIARRPVYTVLSSEKVTGLSGVAPRSWQEAVEDYVTNHVAPTFVQG
jgi:dTDP-4-dehydrorhamnose reductase